MKNSVSVGDKFGEELDFLSQQIAQLGYLDVVGGGQKLCLEVLMFARAVYSLIGASGRPQTPASE